MFIKTFLIWILNTVFGMHIKSKPIKVEFRPGSNMIVRGFATDFALVSRIDPKHWANGAAAQASGFSISNTYLSSVDDEDDEDTESIETPAQSQIRNIKRVLTTKVTSNKNGPGTIEANVDLELSPKEVYDELQNIPTPVSAENLDKKLDSYRKIYDTIRIDGSQGNKATVLDIIERLQNRVKYFASAETRAEFDKYKCTNDYAINILLDKHEHLKIGPADDFIPEFPLIALDAMNAYTDATVKLCGLKPVFYVIAKAKDFKVVTGRRSGRDPILLVQAPFGFYWQILGAWDEEMQHVADL